MSLYENLRNQIEAIIANPQSADQFRVTVEHEGWRVTCDIDQFTSLACRLQKLHLETPTLQNVDSPRLKQLAETLSASLTYLMEPIVPIEFDSESLVAQLRSSPPQETPDTTTYFEINVQTGGTVTLQRYRKPKGATRQPVAAELTNETLLRIVGDIERIVGEA